MNRLACFTVALAMLAACASTGSNDSDRSYIGTVEKTSEVTKAGRQGGSPALYMFGLVGGLINAALSEPGKTNFYLVNLADGQASAQSDERFAVGDCVEIIAAKNAPGGRAFAYGDARITRSSKCQNAPQAETAKADDPE